MLQGARVKDLLTGGIIGMVESPWFNVRERLNPCLVPQVLGYPVNTTA